jgi:hypothetical protein
VTAVGADLPPLSAEVVGEDEVLGDAADNVIRSDPAARERAARIVERHAWLRDMIDPAAWSVFLDLDALTTERWADLAVLLVRFGFEQGRRFPVEPGEGSGS